MALQSWPITLQRAATISYTLVDEVHSLVDANGITAAALAERGRLDPLRKKIAVCGLILFGTLISTLGKLAYQLPAVGRDGSIRPFEKPWFMVLLMFAGMGMNLPLSLFLDLVRLSRQRVKALVGGRQHTQRQPQQQQEQRDLYVPLLQYDQYDDEVPVPFEVTPVLEDTSASITAAYWQHHFRRLFHRQLLLLLLPTLCDLVGAALLNIGLLSVTASATQMMRQSLLPFAALLGVGFWRKRLNGYHATGLAGCVVGLGLVAGACLASGYGGSASLPAESSSSSSSSRASMAAGIGMILLSQLVAAGQLLIDQSSWNARLQLSPLKIVGCEGLLGMLLTVFVVLPLADISHLSAEGRGLSEDTWDTLVMIASRPLLQILLLVYTGSLQAYNICGMVTAGELSAVDTTLLQAVRTLFVWITNLVVYAVAAAVTPDRTDQAPLQTAFMQAATAAAADATAGLEAQGQQGAAHVVGEGALLTTDRSTGTQSETSALASPQHFQRLEQQQHQQRQRSELQPPQQPTEKRGPQHQQQQQQQEHVEAAAIQPAMAQAQLLPEQPTLHLTLQQQQQQQTLRQQQQQQTLRQQQQPHPQQHHQQQQRRRKQQHQQQQPVQVQQLHNYQQQKQYLQPGSSSSRPSNGHSSPSISSGRSYLQQLCKRLAPCASDSIQHALSSCCYSAALASTAAAAVAASGSPSVSFAAAHSGAIALPPALNAAAGAAAAEASSPAAAAVAAAATDAAAFGLPGEPWLVWSFMQAAGFALLVVAAITYSRGDNERWRRQLEAEAALIFADMPFGGNSRAASVTGSMAGSYRPFTANMDIDSAAFLRSSQGVFGRGRESAYGVTPTSYASPLRRRDSGSSLGRSIASGGVLGASPNDVDGGFPDDSVQVEQQQQQQQQPVGEGSCEGRINSV